MAVQIEGAWFRYGPEGPDVLRDLSLKVQSGSIFAIMGGNGAGKSTALSLAAGLCLPYRGQVMVFGTPAAQAGELVGLLPQCPQSLFVCSTVKEELVDMVRPLPISKAEQARRAAEMAQLCEISHLLPAHPFDLSGGEQQRTALAKVLLRSPKLLLLDEPTKGMDAAFKGRLGRLMQRLQKGGTTIFMVSHDVEFCARYATCCAMLFDGGVVSQGTPREFFPGNSFYTTAAHRMARHRLPEVVTPEDLIQVCGGQVPKEETPPAILPRRVGQGEPERPPLPRWRKRMSLLLLTLAGFWGYLGLHGASWLSWLEEDWRQVLGTLLLCAFGLAALACLRWGRAEKEHIPVRGPTRGGRLSLVVVALLAPATLWLGHLLWADGRLYVVALLLMLEGALPFLADFEGRRPKARELVLIAVLTGLAVAGRVAFAAAPQFKPLLAVAIVAGAGLGCETGFLVGSLSMLVSNFYVGHSAYTPFQMFAAGLVGFLAGALFRRLLTPGRVELALFGFLAALCIYGGILDPVVLLVTGQPLMPEKLAAVYLSGLPMNLIHALSTAFFLAAAGPELLGKVARVRRKFGLFT